MDDTWSTHARHGKPVFRLVRFNIPIDILAWFLRPFMSNPFIFICRRWPCMCGCGHPWRLILWCQIKLRNFSRNRGRNIFGDDYLGGAAATVNPPDDALALQLQQVLADGACRSQSERVGDLVIGRLYAVLLERGQILQQSSLLFG